MNKPEPSILSNYDIFLKGRNLTLGKFSVRLKRALSISYNWASVFTISDSFLKMGQGATVCILWCEIFVSKMGEASKRGMGSLCAKSKLNRTACDVG